jgi:hypothetical protein
MNSCHHVCGRRRVLFHQSFHSLVTDGFPP